MSIVQWVMGIFRHRPPIRFMSCSSWTAVDDGARAQEQEALEEAVGHEVEDGGRPGAHAERREHVAQLADSVE